MFTAYLRVPLLISCFAVGTLRAVTVSYDQICDATNICDASKKLTCMIHFQGCTKGQCKCLTDTVWSDIAGKCQILNAKGGQCGDENRLYGCKDEMVCSDNVCGCQGTTRYIAGLGCVGANIKVLGETCIDDDSCYSSMVCTGDPKNCTCPDGRIDDGHSNCRKPVLRESGCLVSNDCDGSYMACKGGTCYCEENAVPKATSPSCKADGKKLVGQACTSYQDCNGRTYCSNCEMTNIDKCRIPNVEGPMMFLEPCDSTRKCNDTKMLKCKKHYKDCNVGACECSSDLVWSSAAQKCQSLSDKDGQCGDDNQVYGCQHGMTCSNKVCGCKSPKRYIDGLGCIDEDKKVLGETCTDSTVCYGDMDCKGDPLKCACAAGRIDRGNKFCKKPKNTEKGCVNNNDCSGMNLQCNSAKCQCNTNMINYAFIAIGCKENGSKRAMQSCTSNDECEGQMLCMNCENILKDKCRIPIIPNASPLLDVNIVTLIGVAAAAVAMAGQ